LLLWIPVACSRSKPAPPPKPAAIVVVASTTIKDVPYYIETFGTVTAYYTVNILPRVTGQIVTSYFVEGMEVKKGDPLFLIDPRPYQATLDQSIAQLARTRAELDYNRLTVQSYESLRPDDYVAPLTFEQYVSNVAVSQAQLDQYIAEIMSNKLNVEYCHINAPIDGKTSIQLIDNGNMVYSQQTQALLTINQIAPIHIDFTIPEKHLPILQKYVQDGSLLCEVIVPERKDKVYDAQLVLIDNQIQTSTGTLQLRANYPNEEKELWPGQYVDVKLILYTIKNAVLVPSQAVQTDTKGNFVFVVKSDMTVEKRAITAGQREGGLQVIMKGLNAGESVVIQGQINLNNGSKVQVKPS
jgi:multidrug efflux system membrane fusion protein